VIAFCRLSLWGKPFSLPTARPSHRGKHGQLCLCGGSLETAPDFHVGHRQRDAPVIQGNRQFALDSPLGKGLAIKWTAHQHGARLFFVEELPHLGVLQAACVHEQVMAVVNRRQAQGGGSRIGSPAIAPFAVGTIKQIPVESVGARVFAQTPYE